MYPVSFRCIKSCQLSRLNQSWAVVASYRDPGIRGSWEIVDFTRFYLVKTLDLLAYLTPLIARNSTPVQVLYYIFTGLVFPL